MQAYTRVLQGHIGLATATFPDGTPGFMIDAFARRHLWEAGLDYQHGTGHGVGAALNVHEGPHVRSYPFFHRRFTVSSGWRAVLMPGSVSTGNARRLPYRSIRSAGMIVLRC